MDAAEEAVIGGDIKKGQKTVQVEKLYIQWKKNFFFYLHVTAMKNTD